jgi:nucleotide-binding universal stress UspA family protein
VFERIVVGLDGSEVSETALLTGAELARRLGVPLHLVRVADISVVRWGANEAAGAYAELSDEMTREKQEAAAYLEGMAQPLRDSGLAVSMEVPSGFAARELVEAVAPGDLLVVASHGRSGIARWFIGSVAEEVVKRSPVPVLVARAAPND